MRIATWYDREAGIFYKYIYLNNGREYSYRYEFTMYCAGVLYIFSRKKEILKETYFGANSKTLGNLSRIIKKRYKEYGKCFKFAKEGDWK